MRSTIDKREFLGLMQRLMAQGNVAQAIKVCSGTSRPLTRIVQAGLTRVNRSDAEVQAAMDEAAFRGTLQELTQQSQKFLEATALASDEAYQSMLEQSLRVFTRRVGELLEAERASLFLVDRERQQLVLRVAQDMPEGEYVRIPLASGIAGAAAMSGEVVRVDDAYADARFNQAIDAETGFRTRSMPVSYTHTRAHETVLDLVCRLLLGKKTTRAPQ